MCLRTADAAPDDSTDLEASFREHMPWLQRRLAAIVGDPEEARDIAQETFARAARAWPLGSRDSVAKWLATVGIRLAIDEVRRRRRWAFLRLDETNARWAIEIDPDLWRAIQRLPGPSRAALLLTVCDGYTQAEVAHVLGVPRGTVASWLARARASLRSSLGDAHDER
jgi:RNA polymerase sigma-70 factor, ECF subfamily